MAKAKVVYRTRTTKKRKGGRRKPTISLAVIAGMVPAGIHVYNSARNDGATGGLHAMSRTLTGYDPKTRTWSGYWIRNGLVPILAGGVIHKLAGMIGINRLIANARIPLLRI